MKSTRRTRPSVLVAEKENLLRDALQNLLERDFRVVGGVADFESMRWAATRLRPDVIVVGLSLLQERDLREVRAVPEAAPPARFVVVAHQPATAAGEALSAAAAGWVLRSATAEELRAAVRAAGAGRRLVFRPPAPSGAREGEAIGLAVTPQAADVVRLIARGKVMKEVAADLGISVRTVAFHKYKTMRHLGLDSTAALVRYAVRNDML
jgi:DNA-binding NarL/FixJ family response regulator